jgi:hypothetical protein
MKPLEKTVHIIANFLFLSDVMLLTWHLIYKYLLSKAGVGKGIGTTLDHYVSRSDPVSFLQAKHMTCVQY